MQFKLSVATATALALLMGAAYADSNFANVEQNGADNGGVVTQGPGSGNRFGTQGGSPGAALQSGSNNDLNILQSGDFNEIGTTGSGFDQSGKRNHANITQTWDRNTVGEVRQVDQTSSGSATRNTLKITQDGGSINSVTSVLQTRTNGFNGQDGNDATITQFGSRNQIGRISQTGRTNSAEVTQTGNRNKAGTIRQDGTGNEAVLTFTGARNGATGFDTSGGLGNDAFGSLSQGDIRQNGLGNILHFSANGDGTAFGFDQNGIANSIEGSISGNGNQIGVGQDGSANRVGIVVGSGNRNDVYITQASGAIGDAEVSIAGDRNGVGIAQAGNRNAATVDIAGNANLVTVTQASLLLGNTATVDVLHGNDNSVDIDQDNFSRAKVTIQGNRNTTDIDQTGNNDATVDIDGNRNTVSSLQTTGLLGSNVLNVDVTGSQNGFRATQKISGGGTNTANVSFTGNNNHLDVTQTKSGLGSGNSLTVTLYGNRNNDPALGGFSFPALTDAVALAKSIVPLPSSFGPGTIYQAGKGNMITLKVGSPTEDSNRNLFAFAQNGNANGIDGSINGIGNQAVVVQNGDSNFTSFSQVGNFNVLGVSQ